MVAGQVDNQDVDLDELRFLQEIDKRFDDHLQADPFLQRCYSSYCGKKFWGPLLDGRINKASPRTGTTLHYIISALKIRARFAIKQYERLCRVINLLQGTKDEKIEVMKRVNGELKSSAEILGGFKDHPDIAAAIGQLDTLWQPPYVNMQFGVTKIIPQDEDDGTVNPGELRFKK